MTTRLLSFVVVLAFGLGGCAKRHTAVRTAPYSKHQIEAGLSPEQTAMAAKNCYKGMPALSPEWPHGPTRFVFREGYVLQHSSEGRIPVWVCEGVRQAQLTGDQPRKNEFAPDPTLPPGVRAELSDYKGSGYDRGHMAPAGNQTVDATLKKETFYLSNMAPQAGAHNQQVWAALEDQTRVWVNSRGVVFELTGGFFYDPAEENPATADGLINFFVIGANSVAVPTHFYKILIAKNAGGQDEAVAFVMENRKYPKPYNFADHIQSIRWIEERTGINFFPDLDPDESNRLERNKNPIWQ